MPCRHLGRQGAGRIVAGENEIELGRHAFGATKEAPRPVAMAFAFD